MVVPVELLELLREVEEEDPLDLGSLNKYGTLARADVAEALCGHLQQLSAQLPTANDREPILMVIIARLVLDNLNHHVKNMDEVKAGEAAREFLQRLGMRQ